MKKRPDNTAYPILVQRAFRINDHYQLYYRIIGELLTVTLCPMLVCIVTIALTLLRVGRAAQKRTRSLSSHRYMTTAVNASHSSTLDKTSGKCA